MAQAMILRRGGSLFSVPAFAYTGTAVAVKDGKGWKIRFLTGGTLTFRQTPGAVDVFCVGGGGGIVAGHIYTGSGGGGYTVTSKGLLPVANTAYAIVVGAGGAGARGGTTSALGVTAEGGYPAVGGYGTSPRNGGNGGSGGSSYGCNGVSDGANGRNGDDGSPGTGQGTTTREFGEATGQLYAGSGGGGGWNSHGTGGEGGGGNGAQDIAEGPQIQATSGAANTGGGGGGAAGTGWPGGSGGSGIVVMRNHRA